MRGIVKFFNKEKKFGFICPDDNSKDVFVHYNDIENESKILIDGQHVEFELAPGINGHQKARNVRVVTPDEN